LKWGSCSSSSLVTAKDVGDDFLGHSFGRGKKQVIDNCFPAVPHRQRLGTKPKPATFFNRFWKAAAISSLPCFSISGPKKLRWRDSA
jgi:hypothetical protein